MPHTPLLRVVLRLLLAMSLLLPGAPALAQEAAPAAPATIHFHRPGGDYEGWGLHVWDGAAEETQWAEALPPTGTDDFGVFWEVPLRADATSLGFIIHRGDEKDPGPDMALAVGNDTGVRACLNLASCIGGDGVSACTQGIQAVNSTFVSAQVHITAAMVQCFAAATTCDGVRACLNGGVAPTPCTMQSITCSGSQLVTCADGVGAGGARATTTFDCSAVGLTCVTGTMRSDCGLGSCAGLSAACVGSQVQFCTNGILRGLDCALFSATCTGQTCVGSGSSCSGATS